MRIDIPPADLPDADLVAEIGQLLALSLAAAMPEDDLTEAGHARLFALQDELERRLTPVAQAARACGLCGRTDTPLAQSRAICAACAFWPLD